MHPKGEVQRRTAEAKAHVAEIQKIIASAAIETVQLPIEQQEAYRRAFDRAEAEGKYIMHGGPGAQ